MGANILVKTEKRLDHVRARVMNSATGFSSTVGDLMRFYQAHLLRDERLLPDRVKREMQRIQFKDNTNEQGLGFEIATVGKRQLRGHGGGYPGFITFSGFDPQDELILVALTNAADGRPRTLVSGMLGLFDAVLQDPARFEADQPEQPSQFSHLTGLYRSVRGDEMVAQVGDRLVRVDADSLEPGKHLDLLEPDGVQRFKLPRRDQGAAFGEVLRFVLDPDGQASELILPGYAAQRVQQ